MTDASKIDDKVERNKEKTGSRKHKSSLRDQLLKLLFTGLTFIIFLIVFTWYIFRPLGNVQLAINANIKNYENYIQDIYESAVARTKKLSIYRDKLKIGLKPNVSAENIVPGAGLESMLTFGDAVELGFKFKLEDGPMEFTAIFNPETILTRLYSVFGLTDYHIVVTAFATDNSPNQKLILNENGFRINARIYPLENLGNEFPEQGFSNWEQVRDQLAYHILKTFLTNDTRKNDCKNNVCVEELSHNFESLAKTDLGFEILFQGRHHNSCIKSSLNKDSCLELAASEFRSALLLENGNAHARLGIALVELNQARNLLNTGSAYTFGKLLLNSAMNLQAAKDNSSYIKHLLNSDQWKKFFGMLPGYKDLKITPQFIASAYNFRDAQTAYGEGDYKNTLKLLNDIKGLPDEFSSYISSLRYQAKMMMADSLGDRKELLKEYEKVGQSSDKDWLWHQTYGMFSCQWAEGVEEIQKIALDNLQKSIDFAPDHKDLLDTIIIKSWCYAKIGESEKALAEISPVLRELDNEKEKYSSDRRYSGVFLDLAYVYSLVNDHENVSKYLDYALTLRPNYINRIIADPDFQQFKNSAYFLDLRLKYSSKK